MLNVTPNVLTRTLLPSTWRLTLLLVEPTLSVVQHGFDLIEALPFSRQITDAVLDTLLGRPEPFEYVSTTTPIGQTPPR